MNQLIPSALSVRVPFAVRKRGGRKLVITPNGRTERARPRIDSALEKARARAHRWQRMLESGECGSIRAGCGREDRPVRSLPGAPEATLDGQQPEGMTLRALMKGFPVECER